ncbi:MAG TPA: hypothetical protein VKQ11_14090 [Candidatus Sulfotelmatobacter sp.]|nr:hypothetical protein [Candidatus Sulfotelmatobacter sp.]
MSCFFLLGTLYLLGHFDAPYGANRWLKLPAVMRRAPHSADCLANAGTAVFGCPAKRRVGPGERKLARTAEGGRAHMVPARSSLRRA